MKHVLTIAGHDITSGAGITKDLDIFLGLGLHPLSIPTTFVIQGPRGVADVASVPVRPFGAMLNMVRDEVRLDGIKIGVLGTAAHVRMVGSFLKTYRTVPIVVDPVLAAKNGFSLLNDEGLKLVTELVFPRAYLITPNTDEASAILKKKIRSIKDMEQAVMLMSRFGAKHVLLKGGHLPGDPVDMLFDGKEPVVYQRTRLERQTHGTGCALSSLVLSFLVLGYPLREAFLEAEKFMEELLQDSYRIDSRGRARGNLSSEHSEREGEAPMAVPMEGATRAPAIDEAGYWYTSLSRIACKGNERWTVLHALNEAAVRMQALNMVELIPEVQMNIGYALRQAHGTEDVAAFPGRIGQSLGKVWLKGAPEFGASSHVARLILAYMKHHPYIRACVNLRYKDTFIERAKAADMAVIRAERRSEPGHIKGVEGRSLDFLVENALKGAASPPDIIYDTGDAGKEPSIRLFARDPAELLTKMEMIRSWKTN